MVRWPLPQSDEPRAPGLRERKKERVRSSIQRAALRLFLKNGFEQTTVEQIAEAADVSPATFYRYFATKEDSVLTDDYDPLFIQLLIDRPADEPLIDSIRAVLMGVMAEYFERDRDLLIARNTLANQTPALKAALWEEYERSLDLFSALIARHVRRTSDDLDVRIAVGALSGALQQAFNAWLAQGAPRGKSGIRHVLERAIERCAAALDF